MEVKTTKNRRSCPNGNARQFRRFTRRFAVVSQNKLGAMEVDSTRCPEALLPPVSNQHTIVSKIGTYIPGSMEVESGREKIFYNPPLNVPNNLLQFTYAVQR